MPTLIGRFNELLHQLSSSNATASTNSVSPSRQPSAPPSSTRSATGRTTTTTTTTSHQHSSHVQRHVSLSGADRPTSVKRSNSSSRATKPSVTSSISSNKSKSGCTKTSTTATTAAPQATDDSVDGQRSRHRTPSSYHHTSQRHSNQSSSSVSRRESSSRRESVSSIPHHQSRRSTSGSGRRRHSIASVNSASNGTNTQATKKPITPAHVSAMPSKSSKKIGIKNNNNNNNNNVHTKPSVMIKQTSTNGVLPNEIDESLASKLARKMKISAITRKGSNCNSTAAVKVVPKSGESKKQSKASKKSADALLAQENSGCFIYRYLNGHLTKQHPDIISGKTCYDLPIKDIAPLESSVVGSYSGPNGGLLTVDCVPPKPFDLADEVDFIDEDYADSSLSSTGADLAPHTPKSTVSTVSSDVGSSTNASPVNGFDSKIDSSLFKEHYPVAGIDDWHSEKDFAYGISTSLYESHPGTTRHAGDPIADSFAVSVRENSAIIALADGVNWGEKACLASRCAVYGCIDYLNKVLYSPAESTRIRNTLDIFVALLRSFNAAHDLILAQGGHLTTLCVAVICQLKNSDRFIVCTCNVGDSLAYVYSPLYGVREITQASHDIFSMRDMRDALGALGPVSGKEPELNNLTVAMTVVDVGDIVFLTSDGISDNFDPVVGKFAMPKKEVDSAKSKVSEEIESEKTAKGTAAAKASKSAIKARKAVQRSNSNPERSMSRKLANLNPDNFTSKGLPMVSAQQRHELTLLRMEDLIMNGVNSVALYSSSLKKTAKELCTLMVDFSTKLTMAKRHILEDPDLYSDSEEDLVGSEMFGKQRQRRRLVGSKLAQVPGKLDHASIAAVECGFYGSLAAKKASLFPLNVSSTQKCASKPSVIANRNGRSTTTHSGKADREQRTIADDPRYNLKMKATLARFESQDFLECCCEAGPI